jgi:hypothetical protein
MIIFLCSSLFAAQPEDLSNAMSIPSTDILSQSLSADSLATSVPTSLGSIYPTDGADMAELYTGAVGAPPESGTDLGAYGELGDRTTFTVQLQVPATANSMFFDFFFLSAEYPEFVGTQYNDKFEANISGTAYSGNAATDSMGNLVDVNSAFFTVVQSADLQGTGFENGVGGGTGWLTMIVPVDPNDIVTISFTVYDVADGIYDSMVMLDNFDWSTSDIDIPVIITPILLDYLSPKRSSIDGGVVTSVYGEDFNGTCSVYFDGVESSQTTFVDSTELQAVAPPHPEGIIDVDVICDGVEGTLSNSFTYFEDFDGALPPSISTVTPYQIVANGGDEIQVVGSDFISGASVEIDGVAVASTFVSDQLLTFIAPAHSEGFANILVRNPDGLYDELSGALYYTPSVAEPEAETTEPSSEEGEEGEEGNEVDGSEGPKGGTTGGCAHVSSPKEGLGFILMILGVLAWRKK